METFQLPPRKSLAEFLESCTSSKGGKDGVFAAKTDRPPAKKGKCWTEEEHLAFLAGLRKYGKGSWKSISRFYVPTRTSTQIASHAQKYLQRITGATKRKSKFTEIEQQVDHSRLSDTTQPSWPLPDKQDAAEVRSCSEGPPSPSPTEEAATERTAKRQRVCRPTAIRATSSEPDLVKLAESLVSLADVSRNLSPSDNSAFKRANSASPQPGSSL